MSRFELFSPEGLRVDGRRYNELRAFDCSINTHPHSSDGSAYISQGNTKVLCLIRGPSDTLTTTSGATASSADEPTISVSIIQPPYATTERKSTSRTDRRMAELSIIIKRALQQCIVKKNYSRTLIEVSITILQLDGSLLPACINAATLALIDAGISMYDYISACNVALYDTFPLVDSNSLEENDLSFLTIGIIGNGDKINLLLMEDKVPLDKLQKLIDLGITGCHNIRQLMDNVVREIGIDLLSKKL
ncbi:Exosome non-catalytic core component [Pichia californica]|uniref:Ribosomal RNA-processing protein 41 n=1 Tax=Pichia californica TaxID=460514 RepID=A0A9P7BIK7_9ASCO|nr:Exosome non-catalytic core component [[Candida] californica]